MLPSSVTTKNLMVSVVRYILRIHGHTDCVTVEFSYKGLFLYDILGRFVIDQIYVIIRQNRT